MKPFTIKLVAFSALQLGLLVAVLWSGCQTPNGFLTMANYKHARLAGAEGRRVILVGGSNIVQGVDSGLFQEHLPGTSVISMSLTMALGLPFMLAEVKDAIRPGDVVLLIPEYQLLLAGNRIDPSNASFIAEMLVHRPEAMKYLSPPMFKAVLDSGAVALTGMSLRNFNFNQVQATLKRKRRVPEVPMRGVFNEWGDAIWHRELPPVKFAQIKARAVEEERLMATIQALNDFHEHCLERGASCFLNYAPLPDPPEDVEHMVRTIHEQLESRLTIPVLQPPDASFYPLERFHNSYYHLDGNTSPQRTKQLADALKPVL